MNGALTDRSEEDLSVISITSNDSGRFRSKRWLSAKVHELKRRFPNARDNKVIPVDKEENLQPGVPFELAET